MWSSVNIPGKLSILLVDTTRNVEGFEFEFSDRLFTSLKKSSLQMLGDSPVRIGALQDPDKDLDKDLESAEFNSILWCGHGSALHDHWKWLTSRSMPPKLLTVCHWQNYNPNVSAEILSSKGSFAQIAVVPISEVTAREAGLFYLKLFTEINLHSGDQISGKMVWFSFSKARELLRRRRYSGKFGVRC